MLTLLLIVHYFVCILLIILVLLQSGKGSAAGIYFCQPHRFQRRKQTDRRFGCGLVSDFYSADGNL